MADQWIARYGGRLMVGSVALLTYAIWTSSPLVLRCIAMVLMVMLAALVAWLWRIGEAPLPENGDPPDDHMRSR